MQTRKRAKPVKFGKSTTEEKDLSTSSGLVVPEDHPASEALTHENIVKSLDEARDEDKPEAISLAAPDEEKREDELIEEVPPDTTSKQEIREAENPSTMFDDEHPTEELKEKENKEQETLDESNETTPEPSFSSFTMQNVPKKKKGSLGFFLLVVVIAFLVGLGGMLGFSYLKDANLMQQVTDLTASPTPTPEPTKAPTPTEKVVDKSAYTISVLNGSGTSGLAAKTKTALTDAGFSVSSTGNADNSDYTETIIAAKESVDEAYLNALTEELEKTYKVEIAVKTLAEKTGTDVEITLGSSTK